METREYDHLMLRTVFACMACDQRIDEQEIAHIQQRTREKQLTSGLDLRVELDSLKQELDKKGYGFFQDLFERLAKADLPKDRALQILKASIDMVEANDEVEYAEIKFVKLIRAQLQLTDDEILAADPNYSEYLKQDVISALSKDQLAAQFFISGSDFPVLEMPDLGELSN